MHNQQLKYEVILSTIINCISAKPKPTRKVVAEVTEVTESQQIDTFIITRQKSLNDPRFKQYIKSVVIDELFYNSLFEDNRLSNIKLITKLLF